MWIGIFYENRSYTVGVEGELITFQRVNINRILLETKKELKYIIIRMYEIRQYNQTGLRDYKSSSINKAIRDFTTRKFES